MSKDSLISLESRQILTDDKKEVEEFPNEGERVSFSGLFVLLVWFYCLSTTVASFKAKSCYYIYSVSQKLIS